MLLIHSTFVHSLPFPLYKSVFQFPWLLLVFKIKVQIRVNFMRFAQVVFVDVFFFCFVLFCFFVCLFVCFLFFCRRSFSVLGSSHWFSISQNFARKSITIPAFTHGLRSGSRLIICTGLSSSFFLLRWCLAYTSESCTPCGSSAVMTMNSHINNRYWLARKSAVLPAACVQYENDFFFSKYAFTI